MVEVTYWTCSDEKMNFSYTDKEGYLNIIYKATEDYLDLPETKLREALEDYGEDGETPVIERIALALKERFTPYGVKGWIEVLGIFPYLLNETYYPEDGDASAEHALSHAFEKMVVKDVIGWNGPRALKAKDPLPEIPEVIIDIYENWTEERWENEYLALSDYNERAVLRREAKNHAIQFSDELVKEEITERYRAYRKHGQMTMEGINLRYEAQNLGLEINWPLS